MARIGVLKEPTGGKLTVLTPSGAERLKGKAEVLVQRDAGRAAGYTNKAYEEAGATLVDSEEALLAGSDIVLSYGYRDLRNRKIQGKTFIGIFNFLWQPEHVGHYLQPGVTVHSLDLIPRSTLAQSMDVLSSVGSISGYQAVLLAAERSLATVPMITSAGGTLRPAKFLVMGAGVAGLQAIATARRLGAVVKAYDVRKASKEEVESLGASFIEIEGSVDDRTAGGYATQQSEEFLERVRQRIHEEAAGADVVITTARIPGKRAPLLITADMVNGMKPGAVIVDIAAATGGNCALTEPDQAVVHNEVTILGPTAIESSCAYSTSFLLSNNYISFIQYLLEHQEELDSDPILGATLVVRDGRSVNERVLALQGAAQ
ncbi:MAG TPA: NAD(P) transhydrogenase subunit alpha [Flavobacteriales bacterium]|nr:NAD(P) transhydrogenase subunit alpha [Flavobacteriales bacterium]HRN35509.1 NAD(P) transhydrogenase subunit alpha [Flavobacteriales bacterium]HRO38593.1 NAD(P) transhydrogenase subunit alpha [Flavobacteriales bacterium]HRP81599.1 NAD(P) transhydrogenase subunit alpha [Flavobacteriales bacterium]HRQ85332.1 NAD(P) transhydrogenase subunit alpha [Flavobacteriales bacterium]